jgi:hypothetical protein
MKWFGYATIAIAWTPALAGVPVWIAWPVAFFFYLIFEARERHYAD